MTIFKNKFMFIIAVLDSMAECDQDIQKGSSTELTQLVMERQVDFYMGTVADITVMPDGKIVAVLHESGSRYTYTYIVHVVDLDATKLNNRIEHKNTFSNSIMYNIQCKSASVVSIGSNVVMVVTVRGETYTSEDKTKQRVITEIVKGRHAVTNGLISEIASTRSVKEYEFDVVCAKSDQVFIMFLTTTPPQLEIENLATGLSDNVQLKSFSTQFLPAFSKPYMCADDSEGQTHLFISAMVGLGNRVVTKLNLKGDILATLVDPMASIPGPIAAVGDGTLLFNYGGNICLLSDKCKIVDTLASAVYKLKAMCITRTTRGLKLYCVDERTSFKEYSVK